MDFSTLRARPLFLIPSDIQQTFFAEIMSTFRSLYRRFKQIWKVTTVYWWNGSLGSLFWDFDERISNGIFLPKHTAQVRSSVSNFRSSVARLFRFSLLTLICFIFLTNQGYYLWFLIDESRMIICQHLACRFCESLCRRLAKIVLPIFKMGTRIQIKLYFNRLYLCWYYKNL